MAQGEIRDAKQTQTPGLSSGDDPVWQVRYAFRHDGREFSGTLHVHDAFVAKRVESDTPLLVFFDPANPDRNIGLVAEELKP